MKLYTFRQAANPKKVLIYLAEKGLALDTVDVLIPEEQRPEVYIAQHPMAAVPVLELEDGRTLSETDAIIEYLEELNPEPPLLGSDAWERARTREVVSIAEHGLLETALTAAEHSSPAYAGLVKQVPAVAEALRARFEREVRLLDSLLAHREWLAGARFTVADITALVAIELGAHGGCVLPPSLIRLEGWLTRAKARPSVRDLEE